MTGLLSQVSFVDEVTYGTPVTTTRFFEVDGVPSFTSNNGRAQATANRTGSRVIQSGRFVPYRSGAGGSLTMPVPSKSFGFFLKHMLGTVSTGSVVDSNYTHTGTVGSLLGDFFTAHVGKPFVASATVSPFTYAGGKITSWELSCDLDGLLQVTFEMDFQDEKVTGDSGAQTLPAASYATTPTVFSFQSAVITVGGTAVDIKNLTIGCDNNLDTNRRFLGQTLKDEPVENGLRPITFACEAEFQALTQYNQFRHATAASTHAALVATFTAPLIHAGATYPSLVVTIPAARFDMVDINGGEEGASLMQSISGVALDNLSASPITLAYTTTDATP